MRGMQHHDLVLNGIIFHVASIRPLANVQKVGAAVVVPVSIDASVHCQPNVLGDRR
jgi:hypothetical protein